MPLAIDTTFILCDLQLTGTFDKNKRILNEANGNNPVFFGPSMLHFTKDAEAFSPFLLKLRPGNPKIKCLKSIGVDMEETIFNGLKIHNPNLGCLICVHHLGKKDKKQVFMLLEKTNQADAQRSKSKKEVLNNIYRKNEGTYYEYGLSRASNKCNFNAKLQSLQQKWEGLIPGYFKWFSVTRKKLFLQSIIKSAQDGANVYGLHYQNSIEAIHAFKNVSKISKSWMS